MQEINLFWSEMKINTDHRNICDTYPLSKKEIGFDIQLDSA